jgi:selenocysteine-specific elongation factor
MRVIGTAGHVDHGKSTLVQALTGTHPDRLKEEREREMTIDLGFAWLTLPNGEDVGIVDVPGHRDFIENMLAGVGGIDAALFVVAADEGVMPQTREHLSILDILQIQGGVVVLTKIDMIDDSDGGRSDWLDLVEDDVRKVLHGTVLGEAPILRVSARTGEGIPELLKAVENCLSEHPPRPDLRRPRLPIDRVFTIAGFGTVVTGTLTNGHLVVGDEVLILPNDLKGRVRGLQTHKRKEEMAVAGSRTAVNISGINVDQIQRGDMLVHPGDYTTTRRLDVRFRLLPDVSAPLLHNTETKMFIGAAEVVARIRLLGTEALLPGEEGWLQVELNRPVVAVRGDRYILRRPSPGETLGGGFVVDPHPKRRHKRFAEDILQRLETLAKGTPEEVLLQTLLSLGAATLQEVILQSNLDEATARKAALDLYSGGQMVDLERKTQSDPPEPSATTLSKNSLVSGKGYWEQLAMRMVQEVTAYHRTLPLRKGIPREELKSRLKLSARIFSVALKKLESQGDLVERGPLVSRPEHTIRFNPQQQRQVDDLLSRFAASPYAPPTVKESQIDVGDDVFAALVDLGQIVLIHPEVAFRKEDYEKMVTEVRQLLEKNGTVTAAQVRDHFNTSRRYILAFLEHLDSRGITVREGDLRRLKRQ